MAMQNNIPPFEEIASFSNLFRAWRNFSRRKKQKHDVAEFAFRLSDNLLSLQRDMLSGNYRHGGYTHFRIADPKPRDIHKASVRDRIVHHAVYQALYPYFDQQFIHDSYSCRKDKGTHRAIDRFREYARQEGKNNTRTVWILKGDITKCFASVEHSTLLRLLKNHIHDERLFAILTTIVQSFFAVRPGVGIPLGNLTSQLFVNIYLNEFDQFVQRTLRMHSYIRYADDFAFFSCTRSVLEEHIMIIDQFLKKYLVLTLHPRKVAIRTLASGVDFLGWVHFPGYRVLRTTTKRRMYGKLAHNFRPAVRASYRGLLRHGNTHTIQRHLLMNEDN